MDRRMCRGRRHGFDLAEMIPEEFKDTHRRALSQRGRQNIDAINVMDNVEPPRTDLASLMHDMHINRRLRMLPHHGGPLHDGPFHDSPFHDSPFHDGPFHDGPFHDGPHHRGPHHRGPHHRGPHHGGPHHGPPHHGPPHHGPPHHGPPHHGPPHHGPPHHGPPHHGPPHHGPRHHGPPHHGPPHHRGPHHSVKTNNEIFEFSSGKTITMAVQQTCNCTSINDAVLTALSATDQVYKQIASEVNSTIQHHASGMTYTSCNIVSIVRVENCCLWRKYSNRRLDIQKEGYSVNQKLLFHGSSGAMDIVNQGFDERHSKIGGMFGAGIYFAEHSSKSNQYVFGYMGSNGCPSHKKANCTSCERYMLLCSVTLGIQQKLTQSSKMAHPPPGFHSVVGVPSSSGLRYPEYIIYRGEQAYPAFLIKYKIVL